jgi:hypothetical protein
MKPRIAKSPVQHVRRERDGMSARHLDLVRQLPCIITYEKPTVPHHLLRTGEHGMGRKSSDQWAVPMTAAAHDALHTDGDEGAFFSRHGIDARAVARALWAHTGDLKVMDRIILNARFAARLKLFRSPMQICLDCGCDDDHACPGGCHWVEPGLCSRCSDKRKGVQ